MRKKTNRVMVTVRMRPELRDAVRALAREQWKSMEALIRELLVAACMENPVTWPILRGRDHGHARNDGDAEKSTGLPVSGMRAQGKS